jgi:lipooligosaccharide transport system permease protein
MFDLLFASPAITSKFILIWKRNFVNFRKTIFVSLVWILIEPVIFLGGLGYGLGYFVSQIHGQAFVQFLFPGILCFTAMLVSFFEATYGTYHKLSYQKTFQTILIAPVSAYEIVLGEILWSASKGFLGVCGVLFVGGTMGLVDSINFVYCLAPLALLCWTFASLGMLVTSWARNYDSFIYASSGFITPMSMIAGVYFPVDQLPWGMQQFSHLLPLSWGTLSVRWILDDKPGHFIYLIPPLCAMILTSYVAQNLAMKRIQKKLIY